MGDHVRDRVALLVAQVDGREALKRHVGDVAGFRSCVDELLHRRLSLVRPEARLLSNPVGAFASDRTLRQLVAKPYLEFGAVKPALARRLRDEELSTLLMQTVCHFHRHEGRGGEDELEALDLRQLRFERLKGIDREARRRDLQPRPASHRRLQVVAEKQRGVIDDFHRHPPHAEERSAGPAGAARPAGYPARVASGRSSEAPFGPEFGPAPLACRSRAR